jgi:hypothetical protein
MILIPKTGKVVIRTGSNAQWMAQATDVAIPRASQFNLIFIIKGKGIKNAIMLQILFDRTVY